MFTGIVEEKGIIKTIKKGLNSCQIVIEGKTIFSQIAVGDSIAVNGICLTVCSFKENYFQADVMGETISRSNLGELSIGSMVNLERAMPACGRFGGHIVSGHIDGIGTIIDKRSDEIAVWIKIKANKSIMKYIVEKGSITIDGISLTVATLEEDSFQVSVIPHTAKETTLGSKGVGSTVNLENDVIGKYVEKLLGFKGGDKQECTITMDFLQKNGF
ncbi:MAG: riboflavin synthase [Aminipila sp.]